MNILILDDMEIRHEGFEKIFVGTHHVLHHAYTFKQAQKIFRNEKIDMCCLDHDLDDTRKDADWYLDDHERKVFYTGEDFAQWLSYHENCPSRIVIHSHNPDGARYMAQWLKKVPHVLVKPFKM